MKTWKSVHWSHWTFCKPFLFVKDPFWSEDASLMTKLNHAILRLETFKDTLVDGVGSANFDNRTLMSRLVFMGVNARPLCIKSELDHLQQTTFKTLPWPATNTDISRIGYIWNMRVRQILRCRMVKNWLGRKKWQRSRRVAYWDADNE